VRPIASEPRRSLEECFGASLPDQHRRRIACTGPGMGWHGIGRMACPQITSQQRHCRCRWMGIAHAGLAWPLVLLVARRHARPCSECGTNARSAFGSFGSFGASRKEVSALWRLSEALSAAGERGRQRRVAAAVELVDAFYARGGLVRDWHG
jgi:hypothetical protein